MRALPELLAPAGDWNTLHAALDAGADAIYFGVRGFNMRASARNFTARDLPRLAAFCHERGAKAYLTANTLVFEGELKRLRALLAAARAAGIDGVIASDFAVISEAVRLGLKVHASTQMSVGNSAALLALHALGLRRFVLARECSLADIRRIKRELRSALGKKAAEAVGIEVFAHGAMCVSVSGRCFMSEYQTGKSANRGACTQPCRREYRILGDTEGQEWVFGQGYVLSPKDLCALPFLEKLIEAGVDSLKIEGRMRSPEYVSIVVSAYRRALDFCGKEWGHPGWRKRLEALKAGLMIELQSVYNRGFSSGFYHGKPVNEWASGPGSVATKRRYFVGRVLNYYRKSAVAEIEVLDAGFEFGDELITEGKTTRFFQQKAGLLRKDDQTLKRAQAGERITLPMLHPVRRNDKFYVLK
ncbi:MAG: peptidase U32 family protein [Opitutaceae bacterium]